MRPFAVEQTSSTQASQSSYSTDAKLITAANGIRGFSIGFMAVTVVVYLNSIGFPALTTGLLLSGSSLGSSVINVLVSKYTDKIGRKKSLLILATVTAAAGVSLVITSNFYAIATFFLVGGIVATGVSQAPYQVIEQAALPSTTSKQKRSSLFSYYNIFNGVLKALGSLFAGIQIAIQSYLHLQVIDSYHLYFAIYAGLGLALILLYSRLSPAVEVIREKETVKLGKVPFGSKEYFDRYSVIVKLSLVYSIDSIGSGFWDQSLLTLLFSVHYKVGVQELSLIFFASTILTTVGFAFTPLIANKIGLVRTMALTQIPRNVLMIAVGLAPTFGIAYVAYLISSPFANMDIPARQAYTVSIVPPELRTPASGITSITRNATASLSPGLAAYLSRAVSFSTPFVIGGSLKLLQDALLWVGFRHKREIS